MKLSLSRLQASDPDWLDESIIDVVREVAHGLQPADSTVDIIVVDDDYIRRINREYRGQDRATDVISFSYIDTCTDVAPSGPDPEALAGEVYISHETLEKEAIAQGVEPKYMFMRIGVHGLLHVVGFDHETDPDAKRMEDEERRILGGFLTSDQVAALF